MKNLVALGILLASALAHGQTYPAKPIRLVVPYAVGGPADLLARGLGERLREVLGQGVIVENKPGAGQILAAEEVARSPADGYTYLIASDAAYSLNRYLYSKLPYDPVNDFIPMTRLVDAKLVLAVRPDFPASSVRELVEFAKTHPGKLNYGSVGVGAGNHVAMAWFNTQNSLEMQHVPYQSLMQAVRDIAASRLDVMLVAVGSAATGVKTGILKGLAVSGQVRSSLVPDVPTFAESGFADFHATFWIGVAAPAGTPPERYSTVAAESARIVKSRSFREKYLNKLGFEPVGDTPQQFATFLLQDREHAAKRVKASGARLN